MILNNRADQRKRNQDYKRDRRKILHRAVLKTSPVTYHETSQAGRKKFNELYAVNCKYEGHWQPAATS
jgi:hypothetical protein